MKKTLVRSLAMAFAGSLLMAGSAMAVAYTPTTLDLLSMGLISATPSINGTLSVANNFDGSVKFAATFTNTTGSGAQYFGPGLATIGLTGLSLDLSSYTTYNLAFDNSNESSWDYTMFVSDGATSYYTSPVTNIPKDGSATISLDLSSASTAGVVLTGITSYGFTVGGMLPRPGSIPPDYTFETSVAPVPEPATMLLLGTGLVGLAGARRRKANKKA